jgi:hypothetical protein
MGDWNLFSAHRQGIDDPFVDPMLLPGVNTADLMRHPTVTGDGLYLYASTYTYDYNTAWSQRASTQFNFAPLELEPALDGAPGSHDYQPYAVPDHSALYFVRDPGVVGMADIYRAAREGGGFATPEPVAGINGAAVEIAPVISPDELTLYFASDRLGALDIFEARRADRSMPFDAPAPITALMTPEEETPGWISADGCVLYFSRFVLETQTDLFVARRGF